MPRPFAPSALLVACLLILPGCGDSGNNQRVSGRLLKGGAKYDPPPGHLLGLTFVAIEVFDAKGKPVNSTEPYEASVDDDRGTFTVPGREGYGIPPGKYRVMVTQRMSREAFEAAKPKAAPGKPPITRETDFLGGKFGAMNSPILREIKGTSEVVIDLDRPTEGG